MIAHRFAAAAERGDRAAMASLFAEDVTYHTPVTTADLHGRDLTLRFLAEGTRIVDDLEYTDQVSDDERTILFWKAILDRRELLGATVLADEAGGLIHDITVLQRPWGVVAAFRDATLQALADVVPMPAWQLDGRRAPAPDPNAGVGQRPGGSLRLAPTVAFHSPILTKTVYGQENVEAIQKLMDGIQGVRTYIARFTSKKRLVEYWNCAIDGHLQQGIDVFELDDDGEGNRPDRLAEALAGGHLAVRPGHGRQASFSHSPLSASSPTGQPICRRGGHRGSIRKRRSPFTQSRRWHDPAHATARRSST